MLFAIDSGLMMHQKINQHGLHTTYYILHILCTCLYYQSPTRQGLHQYTSLIIDRYFIYDIHVLVAFPFPPDRPATALVSAP